MKSYSFHVADQGDVSSMLDIYRPLVENTAVSFEYQAPTADEFWGRVNKTLETRPYLVCRFGDQVAGYAYASQHRERTGYDWCSEVSVYVNPDFHRAGVARALYTALLEILERLGYRTAYAAITVPNEPSVEFHRSMGFQYLTIFQSIGYKLGKWQDVAWWYYAFRLKKPVNSPAPFSSIQNLPVFQDILDGAIDQLSE